MSTISIKRAHSLSHKQAVDIATKIAAEMKKEYGISSTWTGKDIVHVKGTGVTGKLVLMRDNLELDLKLGFVVAMFRESIQKGIEDKLDSLLASKASKK